MSTAQYVDADVARALYADLERRGREILLAVEDEVRALYLAGASRAKIDAAVADGTAAVERELARGRLALDLAASATSRRLRGEAREQ